MDDGRDGPPLGLMAGRWFVGAGILLLLPRQWVSAATAMLIGIVLIAIHQFRSGAGEARASEGARGGAEGDDHS